MMDENELRQWLINSFGPLEGEAAFQQFSSLPEQIRETILSQGPQGLPNPNEVKSLMRAFSQSGLNTTGDLANLGNGAVNARLAKSIALQKAHENVESAVSASEAAQIHAASSAANLWLDSATDLNPVKSEVDVLTRADWVEATMDTWVSIANPVARSMSDAMTTVFTERLGDAANDLFSGEVSGIFAGPVPIPLPDDMKSPDKLMAILGNTSFALQMGHAAGDLSTEVFASFDQDLALTKNPAGALIPRNIAQFAHDLEIDVNEVFEFFALREAAHARLFASTKWLMPRIEALIGKYARGIQIDLDAMEEQIREASDMNPESLSAAVNITNVATNESDEQVEAIASLEDLLALVEGWVDCVTWRAGMAYLPHIEQLREMIRRQRASGGPAEVTFENLIGMQMRPKRLRAAAALWESITMRDGMEKRDAMWNHPDLMPVLDDSDEIGEPWMTADSSNLIDPTGLNNSADFSVPDSNNPLASSVSASAPASAEPSMTDWDAELDKLLLHEKFEKENPSHRDDADDQSEEDPNENDTDPGLS
jgi:putative hydrolase